MAEVTAALHPVSPWHHLNVIISAVRWVIVEQTSGAVDQPDDLSLPRHVHVRYWVYSIDMKWRSRQKKKIKKMSVSFKPVLPSVVEWCWKGKIMRTFSAPGVCQQHFVCPFLHNPHAGKDGTDSRVLRKESLLKRVSAFHNARDSSWWRQIVPVQFRSGVFSPFPSKSHFR